jgi:hypothetical protein
MAEVTPCGNKSPARRSERISKLTKMKDSSLITVPPGFEPKVQDQEALHEGSKTQEEQSAEALETKSNKQFYKINVRYLPIFVILFTFYIDVHEM